MAILLDRATANQNLSHADTAALDLSGQISLMAWCNLTQLPSTAGDEFGIICKFLNAGDDKAYYLKWDDAADKLNIVMSLNGADNFINSDGATSVVAGVWTHAAMTYDQVRVKLYINGVQDLDQAETDGLFNSSQPLRIGSRSDQSDDYDGLLDDVRIYDRGLSAAEIETIFAAEGTDGIVENIVARWFLDEQAPGVTAAGAGSIKDLGPNGLNLTPNNSPVYAEGILRSRRKLA